MNVIEIHDPRTVYAQEAPGEEIPECGEGLFVQPFRSIVQLQLRVVVGAAARDHAIELDELDPSCGADARRR